MHGHDSECTGLQRHPLCVRPYAYSDPVRREPRLEPEHVRSDQESPIALSKHLEDEELHIILLHNVDFEEGELDYRSKYKFRENHHAVLSRDAA